MELHNIKIGADPELFIVNKNTGKVISAVGLIPGTKDEPFVVSELGEGFALQTDNILAEFNIPPVNRKYSFINNIQKMKEYIRKYVQELNPELDILCASSKTVGASQLKSEQAMMFGCDVDYNVYTQSANPKPKNADKTRIRSCGFHIHCGYDNPNVETSLKLIKYFDMFLGIPSLLYDTDKRRRSLYGKAGCFRLCKYGCEYRSIGGALLASEETLSFVWNQTMKVLHAFEKNYSLVPEHLVVDCINSSNVKLAKQLIEDYNLV